VRRSAGQLLPQWNPAWKRRSRTAHRSHPDAESYKSSYTGAGLLSPYLLYRYGFTDGEEHPLIGTAIYFHLTKGRAKKTEEQAMDNLWLELPWWFI
jgi:RNA polymerase primary sigma factor/RNA polymerase sporulation-specific sigma factor